VRFAADDVRLTVSVQLGAVVAGVYYSALSVLKGLGYVDFHKEGTQLFQRAWFFYGQVCVGELEATPMVGREDQLSNRLLDPRCSPYTDLNTTLFTSMPVGGSALRLATEQIGATGVSLDSMAAFVGLGSLCGLSGVVLLLQLAVNRMDCTDARDICFTPVSRFVSVISFASVVGALMQRMTLQSLYSANPAMLMASDAAEWVRVESDANGVDPDVIGITVHCEPSDWKGIVQFIPVLLHALLMWLMFAIRPCHQPVNTPSCLPCVISKAAIEEKKFLSDDRFVVSNPIQR
jgi:hypothetical protein